MERILYFKCQSGISGDMAVASMIDLGADKEGLLRVLDSIPADGFSVRISTVKRSMVDVCDFDVILDEDNHDHDPEYLYGETWKEETHGHGHRNLSDVMDIISGTDMTDSARRIAERIFSIIAEAESKVHGVPVEEVHFHEVGAIDSIVDVIALAYCVDDLSPNGICFSPLYEGTGTVRCQHGVLPVPVPAVLEIASKYGIPLIRGECQGEFVTPTGIAFAAAVRNIEVPDRIIVRGTGYGAGKRITERPGFVTAMMVDTYRTVACELTDDVPQA
ncbi:MAG: LarC family nickel insertion protein [Candidatus Methanomethylophilaceae archaeon]